jgi:hypothetical protein
MAHALLCGLLAALGCHACQPPDQSGTGSGSAATSDAGAGTDAAVAGTGCGAEQQSGLQLCSATAKCPGVTVDTQAMPNCGFRIIGTAVDLVCVCGTQVCPMGIFSTCAEATHLLTQQTPSTVCVQVSEGRCSEASPTAAASPTSSSSSAPSGCDRECLQQCGGGSGCASVCNCAK